MTPHDQMIHTPDGKTVVVKVGDDQNLQSNIKPEFSFDYDSLNFSTSTKERVHGGETIALTDLECAEIKAYLETVEEDTALTAKIQRLNECENYLRKTDWYVIRQQEIGTAIPADVSEERAVCRQYISDVRDSGVIR